MGKCVQNGSPKRKPKKINLPVCCLEIILSKSAWVEQAALIRIKWDSVILQRVKWTCQFALAQGRGRAILALIAAMMHKTQNVQTGNVLRPSCIVC